MKKKTIIKIMTIALMAVMISTCLSNVVLAGDPMSMEIPTGSAGDTSAEYAVFCEYQAPQSVYPLRTAKAKVRRTRRPLILHLPDRFALSLKVGLPYIRYPLR